MVINTPKTRKTIFWIGMGACIVGSHVALFADEKGGQPEGDRHAEIKRLIELLDAPSFLQREQASRQLLEIGEPAVAQLDDAAGAPSFEVRARAQAVLRTLHARPLRAAFIELAKQPDERISVERGMWLIARVLNPRVRREDLDRQLDEIAKIIRTRLGTEVDPRTADPKQVVDAMRSVLFEEYKFTGNVADYDNPDNSSLEKVLATRKGLPIMLSHLVVAVGDRLGVPIVGLPTPGRYIVKYDASRVLAGMKAADIFLDPFNSGKILTHADLAQMFPGIVPGEIAPSTHRDVLVRMLTNLERHLFDSHQTEKAYQVLEYKQIMANKEKEEEG